MIYNGVGPASHYARIYRRRDRHARRIWLPTAAFQETVERLRDLGEQPVLVGTVDVAFPPYHYMLFLSADLSTVVGCLGVNQQFQFAHPNRMAVLAGEAVAWVADDFPGWILVRLVDAAGHSWFFVDKVPVFTADAIGADTQFPVPVGIRCRIRASEMDGQILAVRTDVDGVATQDGTDEFRVRRDQVRDLP